MGLNDRGIISAVQVVVYVPILGISILLVLRHGFARDLGWIFLAVFALIRVIGAILLIVAEQESHASSGLIIAAFTLESAGLSPLLLATSGFLSIVEQRAQLRSRLPIPSPRILRTATVVALILAIVAGTQSPSVPTSSSGSSNDNSGSNSLSTTESLRKASAILFLAVFVCLAIQHGLYWVNRDRILRHRRRLLIAILSALPFLAVRLIYSIISAFSNPFTSKFSIVGGSIAIFAAMSVATEICVVLIYTVTGMSIPLNPDADKLDSTDWDRGEGGYPMPPQGHNQNVGVYAPPYRAAFEQHKAY